MLAVRPICIDKRFHVTTVNREEQTIPVDFCLHSGSTDLRILRFLAATCWIALEVMPIYSCIKSQTSL